MGIQFVSNGASDDSEDWLRTARDVALGGGSAETVERLLSCYKEAEADRKDELGKSDRRRAGIPENWTPPKKR